ncbi:MAG: phage terminase large subunit family protein [Paludibaculum sp.]
MFLPQGTSARPGWVTLDPFQREPLDCWAASHPCRRMVLKCGSQIMKTFIAQGATGYSVEVEPGPILIGQPREKDVKAFVTDKLDPMLENTPSLKALIAKKKSRDSMNNTEFKKFNGGSITIAGAHAPANFCMRGVRYAIFDEPDRYPRSAGKEGSPVALGRQRLTDYSDNYKELMGGTPTMAGESIIEEEYEGSDQREWFVPCPECSHEQILRFDQLRWGTFFDVEIAILDAHYQCESCNALIPHHKKAWMNDRGRWIPQNPKGAYPGFHASQMISPRKSWGMVAVESVKAKGDREKEITFTNTVLAEAYSDKGETVDHEKVLGRVEDYNLGIVPNGPVFLTAGIDVQKDRIEMHVQGWARGKARWVVDYVVLQGDPKRPEVWESLTEAINVAYESEAGVSLPIARCMIDSGYATTEVYAWARLQGSSRVLVGKGYDRGIGILGSPTSAEVDWRGKKAAVRGQGVAGQCEFVQIGAVWSARPGEA